uniref:G_PROTEIN_RECEP_F1_2 domain-containing protein n=1 Tax=Parastrongyloides trichosuri TaxID=131310 RepID=A0A0N4ZSY6_PARTI
MEENGTCHDMEDLFLTINPNQLEWTTYPVISFSITFIYAALMIIGIFGNSGVVMVVLKNKRLRNARNIFLMNLMVTDLILCCFGIPLTYIYAREKKWTLGLIMCRLTPLGSNCAVFVSSWSLCAIALDKFIHIVNPIRQPVSINQATIITILIWILSILANIPPIVNSDLKSGDAFTSSFEDKKPLCGVFCEETWENMSTRQTYGLIALIFQFIVPMGIITYCYWRILHKVAKDSIIHNVQFSNSLSASQRNAAINRKRRVNYILIAMVLAFILCWFPLTIYNITKDFNIAVPHLQSQPYFYGFVFHSIAMSTVVLNPILFWLTLKQRSKFRDLMPSSEVFSTIVNGVQNIKTTLSKKSVSKGVDKTKTFSMTSDITSMKNSSTFTSDNNNGSMRKHSHNKFKPRQNNENRLHNSFNNSQKPLVSIQDDNQNDVRIVKIHQFKRMHSNAV